MDQAIFYPKLRPPLDVRFEKFPGQEVLLLRCPLGISHEPLALMPAVGPPLACFEGKQSLPEIAQRFAHAGVTEKLVHELATLLDQHLFLATPRFFEAERELKNRYLESGFRPAALAGLGYPAQAAELRAQVQSYLAGEDAKEFIAPAELGEPARITGLMSPHIDYGRGSRSYAEAYRRLEGQQHDLIVLLGTSHQYSRHLFHLTKKHFATPLGDFETDRAFVDTVAGRYGARSYTDEILHRQEHSLELQLPFLALTSGTRRIVPILIGSFHRMLQAGRPPEQFEEYDAFVASLADAIRERQQRGEHILFLAGVDMAHMGQYFGDEGSLSPELMAHIAERDDEYLRAIASQDRARLWQHVSEDHDARKLCGFPTMYLMLDLFDRLGWRFESVLYGYHQAVDYERDCAVTFAGMGFLDR